MLINKPQYDIIIGVKTMKEYGIILDFKEKMITVDEVELPTRNINYLQGSSTIHALRLSHSLAMDQQAHRMQPSVLRGSWMPNTKKADLQVIVKDKCKHLSANQQKKLLQLLTKYKLLFDGTLGD